MEEASLAKEEPCPDVAVRVDDRPLRAKLYDNVVWFVKSTWFETSFGVLIVCNAITMSLQIQYESFDVAASLSYTEDAQSSANTWPHAKLAFDFFRILFGALFTCEVFVKLVIMKRQFFETGWNLFDAFLVACWVVDLNVGEFVGINPMLLRVLRLLRLVRLARMVKTFKALDSLQVLIGSMSACSSVLFWSGCVLAFILVMMSIFMNAMLASYMEVDGSGDLSLSDRQDLYVYFGSWSRSMYSMFEVTFGNFIPVTRLLIENVNEGFGALLVFYRFLVGFSVVKVITGVFMHETFRVAASDDDLMVVQKLRATQKHAKQMKYLLTQLDTSLDGKLDRQEFYALMYNKRLRTWLASLDIEVDNLPLLFDFVDNGDGKVTMYELIQGLARLRGPARSIDLVGLVTRTQDLRERMIRVENRVNLEMVATSVI
eukprot:NODE_5604_length_1753_cov_7.702952.p1 GENE.NODE_5604_length_1753_cov_7.702952~~NODE_5604_length_1753_cov_7.702952.p1  ORF type:complete len:430 (+),score=81.16 NODE_5604_length_1753_cov_7.702952:178-1467(+)